MSDIDINGCQSCPTDCTANCDVVDDMFVVNKPACVSCCTCCCTDNTSPYYHTNDNFDLNNGCAPIPTTTTTTTTATTPTTTPGANGGDWTVSLIYSRSYFLIIPIFSQIGIGEATFQLFNKSIIYYSFTHVIRYFQLTENTELQTNTHLTFSYFIINYFNLFLSINIVLHKIFYDVHKQYKR